MSRKKRELIEIMSMSIAAISVIIAIFTILLEDRTIQLNDELIIVCSMGIMAITCLYIVVFLRRLTPKKYIYISYSNHDADEVRGYTEVLLESLISSKRYRFEIMDSENAVAYGENINTGIKSAMDKCDVILLFVSKLYLNSKKTEEEYILAMESGKVVIPILLEPIKDMDIFPDELKLVKSVVLYRGLTIKENHQMIKQLVADLIRNRFD